MIIKPTVFVLGTGASKPYGFPTGAELRVNILNDLLGSGEVYQLLLNGGCNSRDVLKFAYSFRDSANASIDRFLENDPSYLNFGKAVIAAFLSQYEEIANLYISKEDWYSYLYNNFLNTLYGDFNRNYISIITFNYDRSIDCFLKKALHVHAQAHSNQNGLPLDLLQFNENITTYLPIIHLHGQLGIYEFGSDNPNVNDYKPNHDYGELVTLSQQINIISELSGNSESDSNFKDAHEKIKRAELICFMGFSYDDINLKRLNISEHGKNATVIGTTYGLEHAELKRVINKHPYLDRLVSSRYGTCLEILRQSSEINNVLD